MDCCWKIKPLRIFCGLTDKIGCVDSHEGRQCVLGFDACLSVTAIVLLIFALFGCSSDQDVVKNAAWAQKDGDYFNTYSNLWGAVVRMDTIYDNDWYYDSCYMYGYRWGYYVVYDICQKVSWDDLVDQINGKITGDDSKYKVEVPKGSGNVVEFNKTLAADWLGADQYAENCRDAGNAGLSMVIILFIVALLGGCRRCIKGRFIKERDTGLKCTFVLTSLIPVITNIGAVIDYKVHCIDDLNDAEVWYNETAIQQTAAALGLTEKNANKMLEFMKNVKEGEGDWDVGPGYGCVCATLACFITMFFLNLIVPANPIPDPDADPSDRPSIEAGKV